jgi:YbbR domain-containing protein
VQLWHQLSEIVSSIIGMIGNLLRQYFYEDKILTVISLLIAVVLWGAVSKQETISTTLLAVPIEYIDLTPGLIIADDYSIKTANIRIKGTKEIIENLRADLLTVRVSLSSIKPGERVIQLSNTDIVSPQPIDVISIEPQRTRLTIEHIVEKKVKVVARFTGKVPEDYESTSVSVNPSVVTIKGPESRVNNIDEVTTETISLSEHRISFIERPNLDIRDPKVNIIGSPEIEVRVDIGQIRIERTLANIPVHIYPSEEKVNVSPLTVTVDLEGRKSIIESLSPANVSAIIEVKDLPDTSVATPRINLPPMASNAVTIIKIDPEQISIKKHR